ncbi:MAG: PPC domain-containing protein, partial [Spirochaetes bacterium]|nr:PPC domain-containing protein [Spirochaetota bacterium]
MKKFLPLLLCLALALTACSSPFVTSTIAADQPDPKLELFAEHSRAINMGAPDAYEQDDNSGATRAILTDATIQERNFYDDANDWIKFQASAGHEYTVETWVSGYADTYLYLYSGTTLLAQNDDKNSSDYASVINFTASQNGEYLLKVYSYGGRSGTNRGYTISVTDHNAGGGDDGGGGT